MRSTFFALMLLAVPTAFAQSEGSARQVLDACVPELEADTIGLEAIEAACPGLRTALEELGIIDLLSDIQANALSRDQLEGIQALIDRYENEPERARIGEATLAPLLESLRKPPVPEQSLSWFERLKRWLRQIFEKQQSPSSDRSWLSQWLDEHPLPELVRWGLIYASVALVVLLALAIIVNEVRTAARGRRHKAAEAASAADARGVAAVVASETDVAGDRPSALLRRLIATLVKTGRLNGAHSLTHRELAKRARFDDSAQRESFQKIAQLAEREVFSGQDIASNDVSEVLDVGRNLDAQLQAAT